MVERRIELKRRNHRKLKMRKLKKKLTTTQGLDRDKIMYKILRISPAWTEESLKQAEADAPKEKSAPKEVKKRAPVKKKT